MPRHPFDPGLVEQIGGVFERASEPRLVLGDRQREVELRGAAVDLEIAHVDPGKRRDVGGGRLEGEHDLEQRRPAEVAHRLQRLHQFFERQVLVGVGAQGGVARAPQQIAERRVARQVAAQDQRVDEEPDHPLGLDQVPPRDRRADEHVLLAGVAEQERLQTGQKRHEERDPLAPAEVREHLAQFLWKGEGAMGAAVGLHRRPPTVGRQFEDRGRAGQPRLPILHLPAQPIPLQPLPLPGREVGVLDLHRGQRGRDAVAERFVEVRQLAQKDIHRPAVADDVVRRQKKDVVVAAQTQKGGAREWPALQIERSPRVLVRQAERLALAFVFGQATQVHDRQRDLPLRGDDLDRLAADRLEGGA